MQVGSYLFVDGSSAATVSIYTPWMQRLADNAVFTYEILDALGPAAFAVDVFHKASDAKGIGSSASVSFASAGGNFYTGTKTGLLELLRFKISATSGGSGVLEYVLYRLHEITWFNQAEGT